MSTIGPHTTMLKNNIYQIVLKRLIHIHQCPSCKERWEVFGSEIEFITPQELCPHCNKNAYDRENETMYVSKKFIN